jgi:hypothetical protein
VQRFVTIPASGSKRETVTLPIRADRAKPLFPAFDELDDRLQGILTRSNNVRSFEGKTGRELYAALSDEAKAGLLNISKKSLATGFRNGGDLLPHLVLIDVLGDRCFVEVPRSLIEQMPQLVDGNAFRSVNGALHNAPAGFSPAGSFKTDDAFGNLQLTFFESGERCRADVDIDDAAGLGHVFQVARNHATGNPTHPYNIHQILLAHQHLDPGYRLVPPGSDWRLRCRRSEPVWMVQDHQRPSHEQWAGRWTLATSATRPFRHGRTQRNCWTVVRTAGYVVLQDL